jgi:general secretion pathway protein A
MYLDYWQLNQKPFESGFTTDGRQLTEDQQSALRKLRYAVDSRSSAVVLAGPAGVGKSLLINVLENELDDEFLPYVQIVFPQMSGRDLLAYLAERLGAPPVAAPQRTMDESLLRLETKLSENSAAGRHAVIVVDEAHLLEDGALLEPLRLLLNIGIGGKPTFTLILCGQPELLSIVQRYGAFDERVDLKVVLATFNEDQTASYATGRLESAGASRQIFTPEALLTIHRLTGGVARRINRLCDLALLVGFASSQPTIDCQQLRAVQEELIQVTRLAA